MKDKIIFLIIGFILASIIMFIFWPKRIATLNDGSQEILSIDGRSISAEEYYTILKKKDNLTYLLREVDVNILKNIYKDSESFAEEYAMNQYNTAVSQAELYGMDINTLVASYGYKNEQDFINSLKDDYYIHTYYIDKLKEDISEDEVQAYYKDNYFTTKKIYVFSSDDKASLDKVLKDLKKKLSVSKIQSKYPNIVVNDINISYLDVMYGDTIYNQAKKLKNKEYSNVIQDVQYGYLIVYVDSLGSDISFEDSKNDIYELLSTKKEESDPNLLYKIMIKLQEEYHIDFKDSELKKMYEDYKKQYNK